MQKITVQTDTPERLDHYLSRVFDSISRSQFQKLIKAEEITVDGNPAPTKFLVKSGMTIELPESLEAEPEAIIVPPLPPVLYEDETVLVLDKPAGMKVHTSNEYDREPNLIHALLAERPEVATVGDKPELRPGLVHRLDKHASGVIVVAKTQEAFEHLKAQFKDRLVKKFYTVLVYGEMPREHDIIELEIERGGKGHMVAHPKGSERGRDAKTEYDVVKTFATTSLLRTQIHTGRTHQIRVHFFSTGHPVVGDKVYAKKLKNINLIKLDRLFLHAAELTITLPDGEEKTFTAPLPDELEQILTRLS